MWSLLRGCWRISTRVTLKRQGDVWRFTRRRRGSVQAAWTGADQALWSGVLNFWFIGRVWDRVKS